MTCELHLCTNFKTFWHGETNIKAWKSHFCNFLVKGHYFLTIWEIITILELVCALWSKTLHRAFKMFGQGKLKLQQMEGKTNMGNTLCIVSFCRGYKDIFKDVSHTFYFCIKLDLLKFCYKPQLVTVSSKIYQQIKYIGKI